MREAVRHELQRLPESWAIVFNPRRAVLDTPFEELCQEVGRILSRCAKS
jgi:RNase P protein component